MITEEESDTSVSRLSIADFVTLGNALCGFLAICRLATVQINNDGSGPIDRRDLAGVVVLMLCAATCDLFDGLVARRFGGSRLGAELDNLADVISFGVAPAYFVVAWNSSGDGSAGPLLLPAAGVVLIAVIVRLARFTSVPSATGAFIGLPSPLGAMTVVTVVLLDPPLVPGAAAIVLVAWLMVSRLEYPKPRGNGAIAVLAWIAVSLGCLTAWALNAPGGEWLMLAGAGLLLSLTLTVPIYTAASRRRTYMRTRLSDGQF